MTDIYIDPTTGDIALNNNTMRLTANNAELTRQRIQITLLTYRGEWFYNVSDGIPYLENRNNPIQLIGKANKADYDSYIKSSILEKPFVRSIDRYYSVLDPYQSKLNFEIDISASDNTGVVGTVTLSGST